MKKITQKQIDLIELEAREQNPEDPISMAVSMTSKTLFLIVNKINEIIERLNNG